MDTTFKVSGKLGYLECCILGELIRQKFYSVDLSGELSVFLDFHVCCGQDLVVKLISTKDYKRTPKADVPDYISIHTDPLSSLSPFPQLLFQSFEFS